MKPLTIEELKKLEVGDWVWLIDKVGDTKSYWSISENTNEYLFVYQECYCFGTLNYAEYGTKWLAYKNKEQAEGKEDSIKILEAENERLHDYKCKLEKELTERGFAEYAHGNFRLLSDEEREEVRKDTAKEILQEVFNNCLCYRQPPLSRFADFNKGVETILEEILSIADKHGVEVDK